MQPDPAKLANLWTTLINANLRAQWSRLREYWEPQFDASLTRMVDGCLSLANQALPADTAQSAPGQQATPVASLDNETRRVCADNLATALGILRQMAREQLQATIAAMTMDGLLVQTTPLSSPEEQDQGVNILAGGQALAESVTKSLMNSWRACGWPWNRRKTPRPAPGRYRPLGAGGGLGWPPSATPCSTPWPTGSG